MPSSQPQPSPLSRLSPRDLFDRNKSKDPDSIILEELHKTRCVIAEGFGLSARALRPETSASSTPIGSKLWKHSVQAPVTSAVWAHEANSTVYDEASTMKQVDVEEEARAH